MGGERRAEKKLGEVGREERRGEEWGEERDEVKGHSPGFFGGGGS